MHVRGKRLAGLAHVLGYAHLLAQRLGVLQPHATSNMAVLRSLAGRTQ